jgi:alpha-D-xyloside xylohydrolase
VLRLRLRSLGSRTWQGPARAQPERAAQPVLRLRLRRLGSRTATPLRPTAGGITAAFLVSRVTTYKARSRSVYLPNGAKWYDFWTGAEAPAGQTIDAPAPYDAIPIHVRAGSIVPTGPEVQYTDEKPADPIMLWVYAGADGQFVLYEDDGLTYGYEKGAYARIPIRWNDVARTLSIGKREGSFPGMVKERTFHVVVVSKGKAVGFSFEPRVDGAVKYGGEAVDVKL